MNNVTTELPARPRPPRTPRRFRRTLLSMRWWHNWLSVFLGVLLVLWVVSGLIMLLPVSDIAKAGTGTGKPIAWTDVSVSPAQAAASAAVAGGGSVRGLEMKRIRDKIAYMVRLKPTGTVLVDGATGEILTITDSLAAAIAADAVPGGLSALVRVQRVDQPGDFHGHGPLPAWRVTFKDAARTEAWVHIPTGDVRRSTQGDRTKNTWGHNAHVFAPMNDGPGGNRARLGTLWMTSILSLIAMAAGYWLSLPARWRSKVRI